MTVPDAAGSVCTCVTVAVCDGCLDLFRYEGSHGSGEVKPPQHDEAQH